VTPDGKTACVGNRRPGSAGAEDPSPPGTALSGRVRTRHLPMLAHVRAAAHIQAKGFLALRTACLIRSHSSLRASLMAQRSCRVWPGMSGIAR